MSRLTRELSFMDLFTIASGAMISSGLFLLPSIGFKSAGPAVILAYILAGLIYLPALFSKIELSTAMPRAGGTYFFIDRSLGPAAGTMGGVASWLAMALKSAFALIGIGASAVVVFPGITDLQIKIIAIVFCLVFMGLNLSKFGHREKMQTVLIFSVIGILLYYVVKGFFTLNPNNYAPFMPMGTWSVFSTAGMVFIAFGGLTKIADMSEEARDPGRDIPRAMFAAFITMMVLYSLVVFVTIGIVRPENLIKTLTPIKDGASVMGGFPLLTAVSIAALLSFATAANSGIMAASRSYLAMARDGHLPGAFGKIDEKTGSPKNALLFTGFFMIVMILAVDLVSLVKIASAMQIFLFCLLLVSVIVMRESRLHNYRPVFTSPLYPYIHILGIAGCIAFLATMGFIPLLYTGLFLLMALGWFFFYARIQADREPAVVHMVERMLRVPINRSKARGDLGRELTGIIRERDQVLEDYFDDTVKDGVFIDLQWGMPVTGLFRKVAKKVASRLNMSVEEIYDGLMEQESRSSSYVRPGLCISSIEEDRDIPFTMVAVRNHYGVEFSPIRPPAYSMFIFFYSPGQRWLYNRAMIALAEITQNRYFDKDWLYARTISDLRQLLFLGKRRRLKDIYCTHIYHGLEEMGLEIEDEVFKDRIEKVKKKARNIRKNALFGLPLYKRFDHDSCFLVKDPFFGEDSGGDNN